MQLKNQTQPKTKSQLVTALAIALLALFTSPTQAVQLLDPPPQKLDAASSLPARELLTTYWKLGLNNANQSKQAFESANARDEFTLVAYAINRIQQNKTREAKAIAEELTTNFPTNLDGWMLKTWLNTLEDNFDVALINMRGFKSQIDAAKNLPNQNKVAIYSRLGRLIGYFQGPVNDRVNKNMLTETNSILIKGLTPDLLTAFNDGRDQVLKTFNDLVKDQAAETQVELEEVKAENEQERISLEQQNQMLEQSESQLIPQKEQISTDATIQIANLQRQASSLQSQLNSISADLQSAQLNLQYLFVDLSSILQQQQHGYNVSTYFIRNQIRNTEYNISNLRNQGNQISSQLNNSRWQISQIQSQANQRINGIDKELKRLKNSRRRNLAKLSKIAGGPKLAGGKRNSMRERAEALPTYDELSTELYKQQLLNYLPLN